jgi:hypothetical protein
MRKVLPIIIVLLFWIIIFLTRYYPAIVDCLIAVEVVICVLALIWIIKVMAKFFISLLN